MNAAPPSSPSLLTRLAPALSLAVDLGTVLSWIFGLVSVIALASQPVPLRLPGLSFRLGAGYQLFLLLCAVLAYFQFLHALWRKSPVKAPGETSFSGYLYNSLVRLRRPLALIPLLLAALLAANLLAGLAGWVVVIVLAFFPLIVLGFLFTVPGSTLHLALISLDENRRAIWTKRVKTRLFKQGRVSTDDFVEAGLLLSERYLEINWALQSYFDRYEFEQDLLLSPPEEVQLPNAGAYIRRVLSFRKPPP